MGWMDENGYLFLADRSTDMILVGGENVYPAEAEAALESHPGIASSAVIGLPDDGLGQRVHAIVQAAADLDLDAVRRHLADRLARYKYPDPSRSSPPRCATMPGRCAGPSCEPTGSPLPLAGPAEEHRSLSQTRR